MSKTNNKKKLQQKTNFEISSLSGRERQQLAASEILRMREKFVRFLVSFHALRFIHPVGPDRTDCSLYREADGNQRALKSMQHGNG